MESVADLSMPLSEVQDAHSLLHALDRLQHLPWSDQSCHWSSWIAALGPASGLRMPVARERTIRTTIDQLKALERRSTPPSVLILGDSHMERLACGKKNKKAASNLGLDKTGPAVVQAVGGDGVEHLLLRLHLTLKHCYAASVRHVILMIGTNNVLGSRTQSTCVEAAGDVSSPVAIADAMQGIVDYILDVLPCVTVYVCHILPIVGLQTPDGCLSVVQRDEVNSRVAATNHLIAQLCNCQVLPTTMPLDLSNYLDDGLHLSPKGYCTLSAQLRSHLPALCALASADQISSGVPEATALRYEQKRAREARWAKVRVQKHEGDHAVPREGVAVRPEMAE